MVIPENLPIAGCFVQVYLVLLFYQCSVEGDGGADALLGREVELGGGEAPRPGYRTAWTDDHVAHVEEGDIEP